MRLLVLSVFLLPGVCHADLVPTDFEQYQLELLNRARADPNAEVARLSSLTWGNTGSPATPSLNEGLAPGTITSAAKQPLAFNVKLIDAARTYSSALLAADAFTHTLGGSNPQSRMTAEGYTFNASFTLGENLAVTASSGPHIVSTAVAAEHYNNLFVDGDVAGRGHRISMMNPNFREVGIGMAAGAGYTLFGPSLNAVITTQDFATSTSESPNPFLTGVIFQDNVLADNFYTPGEGLAGVTITAFFNNTSTVAGSVIDFSAGGYSLGLASGTYDIVMTHGTLGMALFPDIAIAGFNVKLDARNTNFSPVPEPSTYALMAVVGMAAAVYRRRTASAVS